MVSHVSLLSVPVVDDLCYLGSASDLVQLEKLSAPVSHVTMPILGSYQEVVISGEAQIDHAIQVLALGLAIPVLAH